LIVIGTPCSGPTALALGERAVGRLGTLAGALDVHGDDGVEGGIVLLHPAQIEIEQFEGAHLLAADEAGQFLGRTEGQILHRVLEPRRMAGARPRS
jgi:hypothetical protein